MLLFLDIDGVMLPAAGWKPSENLEDGFPMFSPNAVEALKNLLSNDTEIVLTTSHRSRFTPAEWKLIFLKRGIAVGKLSCLTPNTNFSHRKNEILSWFNSHAIEQDFIIIDDDNSLHALPEHLKSRWIKTSSLVGLTVDLVYEANALLSK